MNTRTAQAQPRRLQRLVRLHVAVREARPILMHFENALASSLSCDTRSHDSDREPRRKLCEVLNALDDLDKPPKRFKRINCPVCGKSVTVNKGGWIRSHQGGPDTDKNGWCKANHQQPNDRTELPPGNGGGSQPKDSNGK